MEIGKVPESVLKRSIFKQIHTKRPEVLVGAGVGEDCAAMELAPGEVFVFSTDPITGTEKNMGSLAVQITANDLASAGAEPVAMLLTVLLPPSANEPLIRTLMQEVDEACGKLNIQIMGGHTEITAVVNQPVICLLILNLTGFHRNYLMGSLLINTGDDLTISSSGKYCMNFITVTIGIFCTDDRQDLTHTLHEFFHRLFFFL